MGAKSQTGLSGGRSCPQKQYRVSIRARICSQNDFAILYDDTIGQRRTFRFGRTQATDRTKAGLGGDGSVDPMPRNIACVGDSAPGS